MKKLLFPNKLYQLSVNKGKAHKEFTWKRFDIVQYIKIYNWYNFGIINNSGNIINYF